MNAPLQSAAHLPYLRLKLALEVFKKPPQTLLAPEAARLDKMVARQARIETSILKSAEAANVIVPEATEATRLAEILQRYPNRQEFLADMRQNGLDEATLKTALTRDLVIEAVLEQVAAEMPSVSELDAEIYYHQHPEAFSRPEMRRLRHILITFDNAAQKRAAFALLDDLRQHLSTAEDFAAAAVKHSQCPTALENGVLGTVKPGQLYPELEPAAFALAEGEISAPLESPIGLHLIFCETLHPALTLPFAEAKERLLTRLNDERRKARQQAWVKGLLQQ
ncbi:MAG: nitrogen fixation protein NifM [Zoogloeaceae bacterium]|jgi:peptidylprolyl isomerase/peptidyl-prolyl cis-trans isomerase C|nr:nitrogen fixation protein NifM [Zoogloeaceae bacterium]